MTEKTTDDMQQDAKAAQPQVNALGISQVQAINEPPPRTWTDYERGCLLTFCGGYRENSEIAIFQHGMKTVFQLLIVEFPPAAQCKAAGELLEACEAAVNSDAYWWETVRAAIAKAEPKE